MESIQQEIKQRLTLEEAIVDIVDLLQGLDVKRYLY
jgi:hypothetical protein